MSVTRVFRSGSTDKAYLLPPNEEPEFLVLPLLSIKTLDTPSSVARGKSRLQRPVVDFLKLSCSPMGAPVICGTELLSERGIVYATKPLRASPHRALHI